MKKLNYSIILVVLFSVSFTFAFAQAPCTPDSISFTTTNTTNCTNDNGTATANISGGTAPFVYQWSAGAGGQTTQTATNLSAGIYFVIITDSLGCADTGMVAIANEPLLAPSICMVTVNGNSTNNIIYWDKTLYSGVDSFLIYREADPPFYKLIGAVSNDSLSEFIDTARSIGPANGDPNVASYRYKLRIKDTCGNYSPFSRFHNTIYIVDDSMGEFSWARPYSIEGLANPVANYVLLCDTANVDVWGPVQTVSGSDTLANDPGFTNHSSIANWRVKTAWGITCTPTRATVNTTRSNIKHGAGISTGIMALNKEELVFVYPNPAKDEVTIMLSPEIKNAVIKITNMIGQTIYEESVHTEGSIYFKLNVSAYSRGLYCISIENNKSKIYKKLVIQ
jgi:hypothetical protein